MQCFAQGLRRQTVRNKLLALTAGQRYRWLEKRDRLLFLVMLHAGLRRKEAA